jgi:two-component system, OmpR family, phosphate regulon response regulator OmpR
MTQPSGTASHSPAKKASMIWVVDDDPELRQMVGTYLIDQGYDVLVMSSS